MSDTTPEPGTSTAVELLGRLVEGQQEIIRLLQAQQLDRQQQRQEPRQQKPKPAPAKQAGERYRQPSEGDGSLPSIQGWKPSKDGKRLTRVLQRGEHTGRRAVIGQGRKADYSLSIAPADDGGDWWNIGYYATPQRAANVIAKMELGAEEPF
ncbi:MAG: hypothetical protein OXT70_01035 [Chloroflexota bacterium]|nr:hypothetical protein [Chloroflexota bacterium]